MRGMNPLISAERKQQLLRDRVTGLVRGLYSGLLVYGRGGMGKSFVVEDQLRTLGVGRHKVNSHLTPLSLYRTLERYNGEIIVLEDCERIMCDKTALGTLRSATFPSETDRLGNPIRMVHYNHRDKEEHFDFCGGIIMLMNRGLGSTPEAEALASRIETIEYDLTDAEVCALLKDLAAKGYTIDHDRMLPEECLQVVEYLIDEAHRCGRRLNLRMLERAFKSYLLADNLDGGLSWQDSVSCMVQQQPCIVGPTAPQSARVATLAKEHEFVRTILTLSREERLRRWNEATRKSQATLYRRINQLGIIDSGMFEM